MKRFKYILLTLVSVAFLVAGCNDPNEGKSFAPYKELPIGLDLQSNPDYSLWVSMLEKTGVFNSLNIAEKYTCFVAPNSAVTSFLAENGYSSIDDIDDAYLRDIVGYHTIVGTAIPSSALTTGKLADTTATGDYLMSKFLDGNKIYINDVARVTKSTANSSGSGGNTGGSVNTQWRVTNGQIHVLDKVLIPVTGTVWDIVQTKPEYSLFTEGLALTGLDGLLSQLRDPVTFTKSRFTLFMVTNDVFAANGVTSIDDIIAKYGYGNANYDDPSNGVYKYFAYHIVKGYNAYDDLSTFNTEEKKKNVASFASNELIQITETSGDLIFNQLDPNGVVRLASVYDVPSKNGVLHTIDGLLPLYIPAPTEVKIEVTDYSYYPEFLYIPFYRLGSSTVKEYDINTKDFPYIRFYSMQEGLGRVWYEMRSTGWIMEHGDTLAADMGSVGWWEIDLPPVVRGQYNFTFNFHQGPGRGMWQPIIDGKSVGNPQDFNGSSFANKRSTAASVSFAATGPHTLRFSQVREGRMELDYVTFTPVQ